MRERLGIAGSGVIACGLAVAAAESEEVLLWARSDDSAERARARVAKTCSKLEGFDPERVRIVTDLDDLAAATFLVEAVVEHHGSKTAVLSDLGELARHAGAGAVLATTTSSLSIAELAQASGHPESFVGFHPFNPVPRMQLVELAFPPQAVARDPRAGQEPVRGARQDPGRGPGHTGVRRQPAAVPVPVQRGRAAVRDRPDARGRRQLHDARRRHADGPDRAARLRRARRLAGDRRVDRRPRPRAAARAGQGRARSAAKRAPASTDTTEGAERKYLWIVEVRGADFTSRRTS